MTGAELTAILTDYGFEDVSASRQIGMFNDAVWDICALAPWPFLEKTITFAFNGTSAVPTNYPTDVDTVKTVVDTYYPRRLYPIRWETFRSAVSSSADNSGDPAYYYFIGNTLYVQPVPNAAFTHNVVMLYLAVQTKLTSSFVESDLLIPARYHKAPLYQTLSELYAMEDDIENANRFEQKYDKQIAKMYRAFERQMDRGDTIEIIDPEDLIDMIP